MPAHDGKREKFADFVNLTGKLTEKHFEEGLEKNRDFLFYVDEGGHTLLHHAIFKHLSAQKVQALLLARPELVKVRFKGQLPLQLFLDEPLYPEDVASLEVLFDAYPKAACERDKYGAIPTFALHKIIMKTPFPVGLFSMITRFVGIFPEVCREKFEGDMPLHLTLDGTKTSEVVLAILEKSGPVPEVRPSEKHPDGIPGFPGAAQVRASDGELPLHRAVLRQLDPVVVQALLEAYPEGLLEHVANHDEHYNIVEVALRLGLGQDLVKILISGSGTNKKSEQCARDAVMGEHNRRKVKHLAAASQEAQEVVAKSHLDMGDMEKDAWRKQVRFMIQIEDGPFIDMVFPSTSTLDDLKYWVEAKEKIPTNLQLIEFESLRVEEGLLLSEFIKDRKSLLRITYENHLMQLALKRLPSSEETIMKLLEIRPRFAEEADEFGKLPLHIALEMKGSERILSKLLDINEIEKGKHEKEKGKTRDHRHLRTAGTHGDFPLNIAMKNNAPISVLRRLMDDVTALDFSQWGHYVPRDFDSKYQQDALKVPTVMSHAIESGAPVEIIRVLLSRKCPIHVRDEKSGYTPLEFALINESSYEILEELLRSTSIVDAKFSVRKGPGGTTLLHTACSFKIKAATLRALLRYGTNALMMQDNTGRLPIHTAVASQLSFDAVNVLATTCPRSLDVRDNRGRNVLQLAVVSAPLEGVICELTRIVKDIRDTRDSRGRSLLNIAAIVDAPVHVIDELIDACPEMLDEVNLLDNKWPPTSAGKQVRKEAMKRHKEAGDAPTSPSYGYPKSNDSPTSPAASGKRGLTEKMLEQHNHHRQQQHQQEPQQQPGDNEDAPVSRFLGLHKWFG